MIDYAGETVEAMSDEVATLAATRAELLGAAGTLVRLAVNAGAAREVWRAAREERRTARA